MATTDYELASRFSSEYPHSFNALQGLVMAMAKFQNNRHKQPILGYDRALAALKSFERKLRDMLLAMVLDGVIARDSNPELCRTQLLKLLSLFAETFPNWPDAYAFAQEYFIQSPAQAEDRIRALLRG
jgi:hypothetical protein